MNLKYVTSLELSKQLRDAGILQESEWYWNQRARGWVLETKKDLERAYRIEEMIEKVFVISAFHVGELGEMLPKRIIEETKHPVWYLTCYLNEKVFSVAYETFLGKIGIQQYDNTEAEARGLMLLYLKQNNLI